MTEQLKQLLNRKPTSDYILLQEHRGLVYYDTKGLGYFVDLELKGEEYFIEKDSLVDLKRGNEPKEKKQILERIVKLCEEREMKVRLV